MNEHKFLVTNTDVGMIFEGTVESAATQIKRAREILARLGSLQRAKSQTTPIPKAKARSLSERILSLGTEFFCEPREALQVTKQLAQAGFHYKAGRVRDELLRMVKRGQLRRLGDGRKSSAYKYVNP